MNKLCIFINLVVKKMATEKNDATAPLRGEVQDSNENTDSGIQSIVSGILPKRN